MDAIEKRARELLTSYLRGKGWPGEFAAEVLQDRPADVRISGADAIEALVAALTPPEEPDQAMLVSMAMLVYHGFGLLTPEQKQSQLREMRKLWGEVMGRGYYSPDNRERYVAMLAARPEAP